MYRLLILALFIGLTSPVYGEDLRQDMSFLVETIENGEALLISGIKSSKDETSDNLMTIIVLPEVKQE